MDEPIPASVSGQRRQAERDIDEVEQQLSEGELDSETAQRLIARYRSEISRIDERDRWKTQEAREPRTATGRAGGVSKTRRLVGTLLMLGLFIAVSVTAFYAVRSRDGGFITGDPGGGVDLSEVTNDQMEAVIAANPDVPQIAAMRLRLADRYFEEGSFSDALPHYLGALEGGLDRTRRARGMARVGWMSYLSGSEGTAESYLVEALKIDPGYDEAHLFLGLLYLNRNDRERALAHLEPLRDIPDLPDDTRRVIENAVARARSNP